MRVVARPTPGARRLDGARRSELLRALSPGELGAEVSARMADSGVPGLALAVVADGQVLHAEGFGVTSVEHPAPVTPDTLFRLASVTKVLTGTAIMRLVEAGRLDLDRPVVEYVPELRLRRPGAADLVTLRMLMSHTAGLPEGAVERPWRREPREPDGLAAHVRLDLPRLPMIGDPGELYYYSNLGLNLAGHVATRITGQSFPELLDALVIEPLGLRSTTLDPTVAMTHPLAQRHRAGADGRLRVRHDGGDNAAFYPSGYAFSTVLDMARVLLLYLADGALAERRLLSPESVREMRRPHADLRLAGRVEYGLTWLVEPSYKGVLRVGHEGVLRGYCAKVAFAPHEGVGVVVLYNHEYNEQPRFFRSREWIVDTVFDRLLGLPGGPAARSSWPEDPLLRERLAGRYGQLLGTATAGLRTTGRGLVLSYEGVEVPLRRARECAYESVLADRDLPVVPWPRTPYVIDDRVSVGFPSGTGPPGYITVNGQAYRRIGSPTAPGP